MQRGSFNDYVYGEIGKSLLYSFLILISLGLFLLPPAFKGSVALTGLICRLDEKGSGGRAQKGTIVMTAILLWGGGGLLVAMLLLAAGAPPEALIAGAAIGLLWGLLVGTQVDANRIIEEARVPRAEPAEVLGLPADLMQAENGNGQQRRSTEAGIPLDEVIIGMRVDEEEWR